MREAAETGDDFMVTAGVIKKAVAPWMFGGQRGKQRQRTLLIGQRFAVFERQIDEDFFDGQERPVPAFADGRHGQLQRLRIAGECPGVAAKEVARELVEHDQQRAQALRFVRPRSQSAGQRSLDDGQETRADLRIETLILAKPLATGLAVTGFAGAAEPEGQDFGRCRRVPG